MLDKKFGDKSFIFSPMISATILNELRAGASEETLKEITNFINMAGLPEDRGHKAQGTVLGELLNSVNSAGNDGCELKKSCRLFLAQGSTFVPDFSNTLQNYDSKADLVDFHSPEVAAATINKFISADTNEKIPELLKKSDLSPNTKFVLAAAYYLKAPWLQKFNKKLTQDEPFKTPTGEMNVPMMHMDKPGNFKYKEFNLEELTGGKKTSGLPDFGDFNTPKKDIQMLVLDCVGGNLKKAFILPSDPKMMQKLTDKIGELAGLASNLTEKALVDPSIPKRDISSGIDFKEILEPEMPSVYQSGLANFSRVNGNSSDIFIATHKGKFKIQGDEDGTITTGIEIAEGRSRSLSGPKIVEFVADHPFIEITMDNNGAIIDITKVNNPMEGAGEAKNEQVTREEEPVKSKKRSVTRGA
jgi:serpin B